MPIDVGFTTFKEGDRVVLLYDHPDNNEDLVYGCLGTVVSDERPDDWVSIRWDDPINGGHTCDGLCEGGHGWNVPREQIKLAEDREINDEDIAAISDLFCFIGVAEENK